jgi:hypothetical protein
MTEDYSEKFETPLQIFLGLFVVASIICAFALVGARRPDCLSANYTYCGGHDVNF